MSLRSALRRLGLDRAVHPVIDRHRHGALGPAITAARRIPGWLGMAEAVELARQVLALPPDPQVVEVGAFLGRSTVVLAGALRVRGDGRVHTVDPFDGSGDAHSMPVYATIADPRSLRARYEANVTRAGLRDRVEVHAGTAEEIGPDWTAPIDLLFLDGDQSVAGARRAFALFAPHVRPGGVVALHNSKERTYDPDHDGHRQVVLLDLPGGAWTEPVTVDTTTFARRRT